MTVQDDGEDKDRSNKSFLEHLDDLRVMLLWSVASLVVGMLVAIPVSPKIFEILKKPLIDNVKDPERVLQGFDFIGVLSMALSTIFWTGLVISMPFILFFIARFVFPGLTAKERNAVKYSLGFATLLFVIGILVGYFMLLGITIKWMFVIADIYGIKLDMLNAATYVSFVLKFLLALGVAFEYPVLVIALWKIGILSLDRIKMYRRHVFVILLIVSGIITPTVDPATQLMLAVPLYVLYEVCIIIIWLMERGAASEAK